MSGDNNYGKKALLSEETGSDRKRILVVDDDRFFRVFLEQTLRERFAVSSAASGLEALEGFAAEPPDLIVLDVEMAEMDGFSVCRKIREVSRVPVIFVTAHDSLEYQLEAFDAGGNDIVSKPVSPQILIKKAELAIQIHADYCRFDEEKRQLQSMAMNFLSTVGQNGVLMNFVRSSIQCRDYETLSQKLVEAIRELGLQSFGVIRPADGQVTFRTEGEPTRLEADILDKLAQMGRIFQFKRQLVVNYDRVSIAITNLPEESAERAGNIRDHVAVLAETSEALCDNVAMRRESMERAEQLQMALFSATSAVESLRDKHRAMLADTRVLLQELVDVIEKAYSWLGTTLDQEEKISAMMDGSVQRILNLLSTRGQYDEEFAQVLQALRGGQNTGSTELW